MSAYIYFVIGVVIGAAISCVIFYYKTGTGSIVIDERRNKVVLSIPYTAEELYKKNRIIVKVKKIPPYIESSQDDIWEEQEHGHNED